MNKVEKLMKNGEVAYELTCDNGEKFACTRWYEKATNAWHVKLPANNPSGRTYIRESNFDKSDSFVFETKTEHRTGLAGGGWRAKMTDEEKAEMQKLEARIEAIKQAASAREAVKVDMNSEEGIEAAIAKLQAKLAAKKATAPVQPEVKAEVELKAKQAKNRTGK